MKDIKKYSLVDGFLSLVKFDKASEEEKKATINARLKNLLLETNEKNALFRKMYEGIDLNSITLDNLSSLPPTNKLFLQEHFDEWVINPDLKEEKVNAFLSQKENYLKKYLRKYSIYQTSGTTGAPVTVINNNAERNILMTTAIYRTYYSLGEIIKIAKTGIVNNRTIAVCILPTKTPCISTFLATEAKKKIVNRIRNARILVIDVETPIEEIIKILNEHNPVCIGAYVTYFDSLIDAAKKGELNINPLYITTVGEKLSKEKRLELNNTFDCETITNYACTECAEIGHMCEEGYYHINNDWIIVEPVDKENNPVPEGELSDKVLVTNLFNYTQPFIRYEINDRCRIHYGKCTCGKCGPFLEVEGRDFTAIKLLTVNNEIYKISPISLELVVHKHDENILKYQLEINDDTILVRLQLKDEAKREETFNLIANDLRDYLMTNKLKEYQITLSDEMPKISKSGKFQQIYQIQS